MLRQFLKNTLGPVNAVLRLAGAELVRREGENFDDYRSYIPFASTMAAAKDNGLSVGDYVDAKHNHAGATQETIDRLTAMGALHSGLRRVCEIGPGTGRYLERVIKLCHPDWYEIYETAKPWREYLVEKYGVVAQGADSRSLAHTIDGSIDLVHAHKVFPGLPFLVAARYLREMARVTAPGGKVVFDAVTEGCMDGATVSAWLSAESDYDHYPNLLPRQYIVDFLAQQGLSCDGGFPVAMKPGKTECLVFTRR